MQEGCVPGRFLPLNGCLDTRSRTLPHPGEEDFGLSLGGWRQCPKSTGGLQDQNRTEPSLPRELLPVKRFCEESDLFRAIWQARSTERISKSFLRPSRCPQLLWCAGCCCGGQGGFTGRTAKPPPCRYNSQASSGREEEPLTCFKSVGCGQGSLWPWVTSRGPTPLF